MRTVIEDQLSDITYPVAYRTPWQWDFDPARNLRIFEIAMREWIGLLGLIGRLGGSINPFPVRARSLAEKPLRAQDGVRRHLRSLQAEV